MQPCGHIETSLLYLDIKHMDAYVCVCPQGRLSPFVPLACL